MSGVDDLLPDPNDRWAVAARRAQGVADYGLGRALTRYYALYFPVGLAVLIPAGTAAAALIFGDRITEWPTYLGGGFVLAGLGALVGGLVYNGKKLRPAVEPGRIGVVMSLKDDEKKRVRRQILGKDPVDPKHVLVVRGAAVQTRKALAIQLIMMPMVPLVLAPQFLRLDFFMWWLAALAVIVQGIGAVIAVQQFRQAGKFLDRTADEPADR